ncbi:hypothetical protein CGCTS75_v005423 [Colletotrichum tropicale]|nr:hypothetical protein CGCTS75_v005423 [Colletotrichum tropicale]
MPRQVIDEPGSSRPRFQTVRSARNSKHDVPCGENCLVYPNGKLDHTPGGVFGKFAQYLELDLKTRPPRDTWVEEKGERRRSKSGRHRNCERPNRFYPDDDDVAEEPIMIFEDGPTMEGV